MNTPHSLDSALYRIGAVSKLSGIPVPTLRVWQTRYGAFSPVTTLGQHRLYNEDDVRKAVLLKSLTSQGHGISQIAGLSTTQLQQLLQAKLQIAAQSMTALLQDELQLSPVGAELEHFSQQVSQLNARTEQLAQQLKQLKGK